MFLKRLIKKKWIVISLILLAALVIAFLGTKFYLLFNFLVGNDIILRVNTDNEYLFLKNGESGKVNFETKITTNPFCSAQCTYKFIDLEKIDIIDSGEFSIKPGDQFEKSYDIYSDGFGRGKDFYRFDVECVSLGGYLCHSDREVTKKNLVLVAEHDLNEIEIENKKEFEELSLSAGNELNEMKRKIFILNDALFKLNQSVDVNYIIDFNIDGFYDELKTLSYSENYYLKINELKNINDEIINIKNELDIVNANIIEDVLTYNSLIDKLNYSHEILENVSNLNLDFDNLALVELYINEFNSALKTFDDKDSIENKTFLINNLFNRLTKIDFKNFDNGSLAVGKLNNVEFNKIELVDIPAEKFETSFAEIKPICTTNNITSICGETNESVVVFLHGHAVTKDAPLEYSLEGFTELQSRFENVGYINLGSITLYTSKNIPENIWDANVPFSIRASYYYDLFEEPDNYKVVLTKSENIDTYAVRMKEVFDNIRFRTGRDKLNIISFSMGGVVMRRHLQLFGTSGFDKVILIGAPNKGVVGDVAALCPIVGGEKRECNDLLADSLFMQKLNRDKTPEIVHNIYGTGCEMVGGIGDGIVLEERAKLDDAKNYVINGTCRGKFAPLHLDLLDMDRYPEVYEIINGIL